MAVRFFGNTAFQAQSDPVWSSDYWELDLAKVPYQGQAPLRKAFEDSLVKWSAMPGYNKMFLVSNSDDGAQVFPTVELNYIGVRNQPAPAHGVDSKALQTVQTSITPNSGTYAGKTITLEAQFLASRTTWTWHETQKPAILPRYATVRNPINPLSAIRRWKVTTDTGSTGSIGLAEFIQLLNTLNVGLSLADYSVTDVVPNKLWRCQSVIDYSMTA